VPGPDKTDADLAKSNAARLIGGIVRDNPEKAKQVSPVYHIDKNDPPFLIIHGDKDTQVPVEQSKKLYAKLDEAGVPCTLVVINGAGHGGKEFDSARIRELIREFLNR
jgi:dipeptidyl aminopeptidase/acylaminoacyl peptidase